MNKTTVSVLSLVVAAAWFPAAHAASIDWDNSSGDGLWNTAANWSTDVVPTGADDAAFIVPALTPAVINSDVPILRDIRFGDEGGRAGSGILTHTAGNVQLTGWFRMGLGGAGSGGTYNLSGGQLTASSYKFAESAGSVGNLNISGGQMRQSDVANVEDQGGWNQVGQVGTANFKVSGGTVSFDSRTLLGAAGTGVANVDQTGGLFEVRRHELVIADTGRATYNISAGTLQTVEGGRPITVGQWDNSNGQLNVSGTGQVLTGGNLNLGSGRIEGQSRGTLTQTGGIVTVNGDVQIASGNASQTGIYNLQGGILDLTGGTVNTGLGNGTFNMTGGELRNAITIAGNSATAPTNPGAFVQAGGRLVAGADSTPGGLSNIFGNYSLLAPGSVRLDISGGVADRLSVLGTVSLAGTLELSASGITTFPQNFTILDNDGTDPIVGTFSNAPNDILFDQGAYRWRVNYVGGDGNDAVLTLVGLVPEPSTAALLIAAAVFGFNRRQRGRS
jgi:hypothetical protein